jgi:hypothetical protein
MTPALWRIATPGDAGAIHPIRTADRYAKRSERQLSALNVEMCMAQHLSLSALSCRSSPGPDAAVRPVIADIRAACSILSAETSVSGRSRPSGILDHRPLSTKLHWWCKAPRASQNFAAVLMDRPPYWLLLVADQISASVVPIFIQPSVSSVLPACLYSAPRGAV